MPARPGSALSAPALSTPAQPVSRRAVLGGGLGLGALLTLAACTPTDTSPLDVTGEPVPGGVLRYFEPLTWTTLFPPQAGFYPNGGIVNNITDRLLYQDEETLELHPWIAEELPEVNDDATEFTFRIREGVTYSDGSPLDAENVAQNFDLFGLGDNARGLPISEQITNYAGSDVLDDRTVVFRFDAPSPGFPQATSTMNQGLLSSATLDLDSEGFGPGRATGVATSGPFYIAEEVVGTRLSIRVREDYDWAPPHFEHQGRAYLDGLDYLVNAEYSVRIGALVSGQADGVRDVQAPDEARIVEKGIQLFAQPTNGINNCMTLRQRDPVLSDLRVRRALTAAIDRERIVSKLFTDNYPVATGILARGAAGYVEAPGAWAYDPEAANALLDEAGWQRPADGGYRVKDGTMLSVRVNIALPQPRSREVQSLVQEDFRRVGVRLLINEGDQAQQTIDSANLDRVQIYHSMVARADYDVVASQWSVDNRNAFLNEDAETGEWGDEEVERILAKVTGSARAEDREAAVAELQDHFVDQAQVVPLFEEPQVFGFRRAVQGFATEPVGRPRFYSVWLADQERSA
ncbi:TIGR04028 family ABC transporter substrate-binding protein [Brevibacterium yomogidense]|uniref:TIGR04028 family ABC transporter substrate-binding protein n=1 Tax=Brevibacterium yomogidense TaxID=946573 RepID=UPI0018E03024